MFNQNLLADLQCISCDNTGLKASEDAKTFNCSNCDTSFPANLGVPDLVPEELMNAQDWQMWKDHLQGFENRRQSRKQNPQDFVNQFGKAEITQQAFADFTGIKSGKVLDIGCGPGKFRHVLDLESEQDYYGIDPLPLTPHIEHFNFVRAIGEKLPFSDNYFEHVVVLSALDHFKDLDTFSKEVIRVLKPGGQLHLLQSTHEVRGVSSALKWLAHEVKDAIEDFKVKQDSNAPHHMHEFTQKSLHNAMDKHFNIVNKQVFNVNWYSPSRLFWSMEPK